MIPIRIGGAEIRLVSEIDRFALDADWLFANANGETIRAGKSWLDERFIDPVGDQLILSFHSYVIDSPGCRILIDACNGNDKERPSMPAWHRLRHPYLENLAAIGLGPGDIDMVMCTHLHPDHVGWNTRLDNGRWVPTFPRARYLFGAREYDHWRALHDAHPPEPILRGSFADSVLPVVAVGQAEMVGPDFGLSLAAGLALTLQMAPGHSPGNMNIDLRQADRRVLFSGDVLHHPIQCAAPWLANRYDFDPARALETRTRLIEDCADADTILLAGHFPGPTAGRVVSCGDQFRFRFIEDEPQ